eukprot:CAMPEP_0185403694 /NCGR_PEP_ID=MMETSP1364-20130426/92425_1 /TAXON_ID=38817 /ORGANISM="Gephyrocapsa oceanica, Strain RCC1303" /LENGTH=131 /DNA_ID=CAMNT_0028005993 /DNA_START=866 /DNA_END=1260 /DNA_ORIENTATION=+
MCLSETLMTVELLDPAEPSRVLLLWPMLRVNKLGDVLALPPEPSVLVAIKLFEPRVHHLDDALAAEDKAERVVCQQDRKQVPETPLALALLADDQRPLLIEKTPPKLEGGVARGAFTCEPVAEASTPRRGV